LDRKKKGVFDADFVRISEGEWTLPEKRGVVKRFGSEKKGSALPHEKGKEDLNFFLSGRSVAPPSGREKIQAGEGAKSPPFSRDQRGERLQKGNLHNVFLLIFQKRKGKKKKTSPLQIGEAWRPKKKKREGGSPHSLQR